MNAPHRILLIEQPRPDAEVRGSKIRHYRLARLRLAERRAHDAQRFAHLKRIYD